MSDELNKWDSRHRSWPVPNSPWVMRQSWNNALFLHYPISIESLRSLVPHNLPLDTYDGWGWISIVPFNMERVGLRGIPFNLAFPELNVRTYVTIDNKPGVYFFSLDATNLPFVLFSKAFLNLPYFHSKIRMVYDQNNTSFFSQRKKQSDVQLECSYQVVSKPYIAEEGSLDYWLTERYCFYTTNKAGKIYRCNILHKPWPIQYAEADIKYNTVLSAQNIAVENVAPIIRYSEGVDVRVWPYMRVE